MRRSKKRLIGLSMICVSALFMGLARDTQNRLVWTFKDGDFATQYSSLGRPLNRVSTPPSVDQDFLNRVALALPERVDVRNNNPNYIASDEKVNLSLKESGEVFVTFLHERAGFRNSFGYFTYTDSTSLQNSFQVNDIVLFPNSSFRGSGGDMRSGDTINLGTFPAGTKIGFFIAANGFDSTTGVKTNQDINRIFYSLRALNPESVDALRAHNIVLFDAQTEQVVIGFEDINRESPGCDQDFNDILFSVTSNPPTAIDSSLLNPLPAATDRDNDGVFDQNDDFPDDPERAFIQYYPAEGVEATLMFEDLWPRKGDFDFNDLVLRYQIKQVVDSSQRIKDLECSYRVVARGASLRNGFGIEFEGAQPGDVETATLTQGRQSASVISAEAAQAHLVYTLFDDAVAIAQAPAGFRFFNTEDGAPEQPSIDYKLAITFRQALQLSAEAPYNPFLFRKDDRGLEVHLAGHKPTSLARVSLLGTRDDRTNLNGGASYVTETGLPFAMNLAESVPHAREEVDFVRAFPELPDFVGSSGQSSRDWYRRPKESRVIRLILSNP